MAWHGEQGEAQVPKLDSPRPPDPRSDLPDLPERLPRLEWSAAPATKPAQSKVVLFAGQLLVVIISGCLAALIIALTAAAVRWLT